MDEDELLEIYNREIASPKLARIPENFYREVRALLKEREKLLKTTMDAVIWKTYANLVKTVQRIIEKRIEKILTAAKEELPIQGTPEEMRLYSSVKKALEEFRAEVEKKEQPESNEKIQEQQEENREKDESTVKVKIIMPVDKYQGIDGKIYGPFVPGQLVEVPKEEGEWLIANGFAEKA
jgi:DNA replication initiation complex subunit (GINS family)